MRNLLLSVIMKLSGKDFKNEYRIIESICEGDIDLGNFIEEHLRKLLLHAYNRVRYYRYALKKAEIIRGHEVHLENFSKIGILGRKYVQDRFKDLLPEDIARRRYYSNTTGGSTGRPIKFVRDINSYRWAKATEFFYYSKILGINEMNAKKVFIWGSARELLHNVSMKDRLVYYLTNTLYLNAYLLNEIKLRRMINKINNYEPDIVKGFPSFLYMLGMYVLKHGLDVNSPKAIVSTGEVLTPYRREIIEKAFGAKVYNFYGAREAPSIAGECEKGSMHVFSFNNLVEIVDGKGNSVPEGNLGRILITPLHNYAMPLIRYEIGDMATAKYGKCDCGSILPVMGEVSGRTTEFVMRNDGSMLSGEFFEGVFRVEKWVKEFQVIQEDYNLLRILIVPTNPKHADPSIPHKKIISVMGENCKIKWEFLDEIPRPPSGKYSYVRSLIL